jgi:lysophospholipase L1-like esterase
MTQFERYIALGDSIISDDYPGPGLGAASLLYENHDKRFPSFTGRDLATTSPGVEFVNWSKTGWMLPDLKLSVDQLTKSSGPTLVVVCVGGNDLLHAFAAGVPPQQALQEIGVSLQQLLDRLTSLYPSLTLRVLNAYDPTDGTGTFQSGRHLPEGPQAVKALNALIKQVAGEVLVDLHAHFLGHGQRRSDETFSHHDSSDPSGWFKMDIEPNNRGAHEVRAKIWESL